MAGKSHLTGAFMRADYSKRQCAFFDALARETKRVRRGHRVVAQWKGRARIEIFGLPDDRAQIAAFETLKPGRGHGAQAMQWLTGLADRHGIALMLSVVPLLEAPEPLADPGNLRAWYERRGFEIVRGNIMMRRPAVMDAVAQPAKTRDKKKTVKPGRKPAP